MTARDDLHEALRAGYAVQSDEPLYTKAEADALIEAATNEAVRAVQGWMALDLHMALGKPVDHSAATIHQGYGTWADWWATLCAEVRTQRYQPGLDTETVTECGGDGSPTTRVYPPAMAEITAGVQSIPPRGRRNRITSKHLAEVAQVYLAADADGQPPTRAVADHFQTSHSTAARWVGMARASGALPPARSDEK